MPQTRDSPSMLLNWQTHAGRGPYLLLVHGFLCSAVQWQCNLEGLTEHFRPVTVELLGHGESPAPDASTPYLPESYVAEFEEIRVALGTPHWYLLGYSLGAALTVRYALEHPTRVIGHGFTNSTSAFADAAALARTTQYSTQQAAAIDADGHSAIERLAIHPQRAMNLEPKLKTALVSAAKALNPAGIAQTLRHTITNASVRARISSNQAPALLLWGQRERRFKPYAKHICEHMPRLKSVALTTGHGVNMEQPAVFNQHLVNFKQLCPT